MFSNDQLIARNCTNGRGAIIAFMGLPGSGKTTIASHVANRIIGARIFCEPDERDWPPAVTERHKCCYFTAITCFRAMRVPQLYMASEIRNNGGIAIVDSYYDKLLSRYLGHSLMGWLIPRTDAYFDLMASLSELDWSYLPDADHLVFLKVNESQWKTLLSSRNRKLDKEKGLLDSFPTQEAFLRAAREAAEERGTKLHIFDQIIGHADDIASAVLDTVASSSLFRRTSDE